MTMVILLDSFLVAMTLILTTQYGIKAIFSKCDAAQEGKPHTQVFKWTPETNTRHVKITVEISETTMAICYIRDDCDDVFHRYFKTRLLFNESSGEISLSVSIHNVSRLYEPNIESTWLVTHGQHQFSCNLNIYSSAKPLRCDNRLTANELVIRCFTSQIYPHAVFLFPDIFPLTSLDLSKIEFKFASEKIPSHPTYYSSSCEFSIQINILQPRHYEIIMTIYPNVSGQVTDKMYGVSQKVFIDLDYPSVALKDCPNIVEESSEVTCQCVRSDNSLINSSVAWFDSSGSLIADTKVLQFKAYRTEQPIQRNFECQAIAPPEWESRNATVAYSPNVVAIPLMINCFNERIDAKLIVSCSTDRVYPPGRCRFHLNYKNTSSVFSSPTLHHETSPDSPKYYRSTCILTVPVSYDYAEHYEIFVTLFPNITGVVEQDIIFGKNVSIYFSLDKLEVFTSVSGPVAIVFVVCGNMCGCFGLLAALYYKRNASSHHLQVCMVCTETEEHDYDDINDGYILATHGIYKEDELYESNVFKTFNVQRLSDLAKSASEEQSVYTTIEENTIQQTCNPMLSTTQADINEPNSTSA